MKETEQSLLQSLHLAVIDLMKEIEEKNDDEPLYTKERVKLLLEQLGQKSWSNS